MDIGLLAAFAGGTLALLSPCAALLMPAFFASTIGTGPRLLLHGAVFYVGLLTVLVPVGVGAGALGTLFVTHRQAIVLIASLVLVVLGAAQALGFGFDPARLLPAGADLHAQAASKTGLVKTVLPGAASGIAGFCAGPILGAVLTLAAARGDTLAAGVMLAVYGAGMVLPLLLIAALWQAPGRPWTPIPARAIVHRAGPGAAHHLGGHRAADRGRRGAVLDHQRPGRRSRTGSARRPGLAPREHRDPGEPDPGHPRRRPHRRDRTLALGQTPPYPRSR